MVAKYMTFATFEMVWLKNLLLDFSIYCISLVMMHCDNQLAIYIANKTMFNEQTKYA